MPDAKELATLPQGQAIKRENKPEIGLDQTISNVWAALDAGPIPRPEILAYYDDVVPGCAEKIVGNWLEESRHRRTEEAFTRRQHSRSQARGQVFAFILTLFLSIWSMALVYLGHSTTGIALLITQIAALAGVFIFGRMKPTRSIEALPPESNSEEEEAVAEE